MFSNNAFLYLCVSCDSTVNSNYFPEQHNQLIFVMVKCGVLFEVRTEFLNIIWTSFVFRGLNLNSVNQFIYVMVKCGVLFEVRTEFLNII
jgi:hypothetical protein